MPNRNAGKLPVALELLEKIGSLVNGLLLHTVVFAAQELNAIEKPVYEFEFSVTERLAPFSPDLNFDMWAWISTGTMIDKFGYPIRVSEEYINRFSKAGFVHPVINPNFIDEIKALVANDDKHSREILLTFGKFLALRKLLAERNRSVEMIEKAQDLLGLSDQELTLFNSIIQKSRNTV